MDVEQTYNKPKYRGKLYALTEESAWEDTGTGYVSLVGTEDNLHLVFREEGGAGEVKQKWPVHPSRDDEGKQVFQLQGEGERHTIILWEDRATQKDWALSFQDPDGTAEIWKAIYKEPGVEHRYLPWPQEGSLGDLCKALTCVAPSLREQLANECVTAKFVNMLIESFHSAEDQGIEEQLSSIWHIAKGVFLLSNQKATERYLRHDVYEDVMGMLEYDDGLPPDKRIAHRQVLKVKVNFGQPVPFEDAQMLERIHVNYRLQYLKDIVLPRLLDDAAFVSLTQMIYMNLSIILDHLQRSTQLLDRLFVQVRQKDLPSLCFLQDICRLAKQIPATERQALYEKMIERKLFEAMAPFFAVECVASALAAPDGGDAALPRPCPRHLAVEVLLLATLSDPSHLRRFLTTESSTEGRALLSVLLKAMLSEEDQGVQGQVAELLKSVMDLTSLEPRERDACLDVFYERGTFDELVAPLRSGMRGGESPAVCFGRQLICELLAFAVANHGYRAKLYVTRHGLAQQAVRLLAAPQRFLQLAPVRLLRAIIVSKDDAYHRYVTKNGLLAPVMRSFVRCLRPPALGGNLLVSATLELLELIRLENLKLLVDHICKKHAAVIQEFAPKFKTLEGLLLRYQQNLEYEAFPPDQHSTGGPITRGSARNQPTRVRSPGRGEDSDDDEGYFESLDEDDDTADDDSRDAGAGDPQIVVADQESKVAEPVEGGPTATAGTPPVPPTTEGTEGGGRAEAATTLKGLLGGYDDEGEDDEEWLVPALDCAVQNGSHAGDTVATDVDGDGLCAAEQEVEAEDVGSTDGNGDATTKLPCEVEENGKPCEGEKPKGKGRGRQLPTPPTKKPCEALKPDAEETEEEQAAEDPPPVAAAQVQEEGCPEGGGPGSGGAEKSSLNHVSKKLKTSASLCV